MSIAVIRLDIVNKKKKERDTGKKKVLWVDIKRCCELRMMNNASKRCDNILSGTT